MIFISCFIFFLLTNESFSIISSDHYYVCDDRFQFDFPSCFGLDHNGEADLKCLFSRNCLVLVSLTKKEGRIDVFLHAIFDSTDISTIIGRVRVQINEKDLFCEVNTGIPMCSSIVSFLPFQELNKSEISYQIEDEKYRTFKYYAVDMLNMKSLIERRERISTLIMCIFALCIGLAFGAAMIHCVQLTKNVCKNKQSKNKTISSFVSGFTSQSEKTSVRKKSKHSSNKA